MGKRFLNYAMVCVVILGVWGGCYYASTFVYDIQMKELKKTFIHTKKVYKTAQNLRYERLVESAYLLAENSTFKANLELEDPASIKYSISEFSRFMKIDILTVVDSDGKIMAEMGSNVHRQQNIAHQSEVRKALAGKEPDIMIDWPNLQAIGGEIYHIVSVPVYAGGQHIIGAILLGTKFSQLEVNELKQIYPFDINLIFKNKLIASTSSNESGQDSSISLFKTFYNHQKAGTPNPDTYAFVEGNIGSQTVYAFINRLGKGEEAYFMCSVPRDKAICEYKKFSTQVFAFAAIYTLAIGLICWGFCRTNN